MTEHVLQEVTPGVLRIVSSGPGPSEVEFMGDMYFRFMDYFYIRNKNLDELKSEEVNSLCRARAMYPGLISPVNIKVREFFKTLVNNVRPSSLLEIGAGRNPVFEMDDAKPARYILADADVDVVEYHNELGGECYEFSDDICGLPSSDEFIEMAIAVFVLHFPFRKPQLLEIAKRLGDDGVMVANMYRRGFESREMLSLEIEDAGLKLLRVQDIRNLCRDHEYWIFGKDDANLQRHASILRKIIVD